MSWNFIVWKGGGGFVDGSKWGGHGERVITVVNPYSNNLIDYFVNEK